MLYAVFPVFSGVEILEEDPRDYEGNEGKLVGRVSSVVKAYTLRVTICYFGGVQEDQTF